MVENDDDLSEDNQVNSDAESTSSDGWESTLEKISELRDQQPCNSLRQRQLRLIAHGVKRAMKERETEAERAKVRILAETRQHWMSLGMIREEDAHLLETVEGPYHPRIECSWEEYLAKKKSRRIYRIKRPITMRTSGCGRRKKNCDSYKNKRKLQGMAMSNALCIT